MPDDYSLTIPMKADASDAGRLLEHLTQVLADLYRTPLDQFEPVIEQADTIFSIKVSDYETEAGSIGFRRFDSMLRELRTLVSHTTAFVTSDDDPIEDQLPVEALGFLDQCRFLQTTKGSFVASIQMPSSPIIREASLLSPISIYASAVTQRLEQVLYFVSSAVLDGDQTILTREHLLQHQDLVNVNVLEDVEGLFKEAGHTNLSFSFVGLTQGSDIEIGSLTESRMEHLHAYVKFVREAVFEDVPLNAEGKIVELRSRNPQGNRNYIVIQAPYENRPTFIAATLTNELYATAVSAHRQNQRVRITGRARRMKTQIKVTTLEGLRAI